MLKKRLSYLFDRYIAGHISFDERNELMQLLADKANEEEVKILFEKAWDDFEPSNAVFTDEQSDEMLRKALNSDNPGALKYWLSTKLLWSWVAAAVILLGFSTGLYLFSGRPKDQKHIVQNLTPITPGKNKAILILANGSKVTLDDASNGEIARQSGIKITKTAKGELIYTVQSSNPIAQNTKIDYNTIETPRGGQYQVNLPDGSKVWLNAASSLRFPVAFSGGERKVELKGEAYFEVAKNKALPFRVVSNNQVVEVLGTHFNINSYQDENETKTTLLEGSVKVSTPTKGYAILKPGQESVINLSVPNIIVKDADTEEALAWKNGYFVFANEGIESVMRKISRWYDVDIEYLGNVSQKSVWGSVSRYKNVSEVLKMLELTGSIHFKIEERRITVMP
jgi:transmembrane sensor